MSRILLLASGISAFLSILWVSMIPIAFAYEVEYDSRWWMNSGSMFPTLEVADLVYVKNVSGQAEVLASYANGDIILFHKPVPGYESVIHRAVEKLQIGSEWYFKTKGDNNLNVDPWNLPEDHVIGKVVSFSRTHQIESQNVSVFSNSAYGNLHLDSSFNTLELDVGKYLTQSAPNSFINLSIADELVTGEISILVNDTPAAFEHSTNSTHYFVWLDWEETDYTASIILPELPCLIILPLFMIVTLLAGIAFKRRRFSEFC